MENKRRPPIAGGDKNGPPPLATEPNVLKKKGSNDANLTDFSMHNEQDFSYFQNSSTKFTKEEALNAIKESAKGQRLNETAQGLAFYSENMQKIMLGLALVHYDEELFKNVRSSLGELIAPFLSSYEQARYGSNNQRTLNLL